jgi:hypothetical protein
MNLTYVKNASEITVPVLTVDDLSINFQNQLLELAQLSARYAQSDLISLLSTLPSDLKPWIYSIFLHFLPSEVDFNQIVHVLGTDPGFARSENGGSSSLANSQLIALGKFLNHENHVVGFSEHSRAGFIKARIRESLPYTRVDAVEEFLRGLVVNEDEIKELWHWFHLDVVPSFYFAIKILQWEKISNLNKLNEFIEMTIERCKVSIGDGVFYNFLKEVPRSDLIKFNNENEFTGLYRDYFQLIVNVYENIIKWHKEEEEDDVFTDKLLGIIQTHSHDENSLSYSISVLDRLENSSSVVAQFKELLSLAELLKIYDLSSIDHIKESLELQESTFESSLQSTSFTKSRFRKLMSLHSTFFNKISQDEFYQRAITSLLSQNQFELIAEIPNISQYESILTSKFWYYYKYEFNNCYKILEQLPEIYTTFLSSISSLPGIAPQELLSSLPQEILEHLFQLNPKEYKNYSKYHRVLNLIAKLLPDLEMSDIKAREIAIEYGLLEGDFEFIVTESFKLLENVRDEVDSVGNKEVWLVIYKVTKIIAINYANDEIDDSEVVEGNLKLLLKLLKVVPTANIHDVIESYLKFKKLISSQ